jgi:hypothetical protein
MGKLPRDSISRVFEKPVGRIAFTGTIIGGIYVARGYMRERLEDVREKMEEETGAKER